MTYLEPEPIREALELFFSNFRTDEGEFKYVEKINRMIRDGSRSLEIDYGDLILIDDTHDLDLADTISENPLMMIVEGSKALENYVKTENRDYFQDIQVDRDIFHVRFSSIPTSMHIREIRASHVDSLRWLEGIIIRTTEIKSIITEAHFRCDENRHLNVIFLEDGVYSKPQRCEIESCKAKNFILEQQYSKMIDWQFITLQEKPEDLPPGASPKSIPCRLTDDLVNAVRPGDRVQIGGVIRSRPSKTVKQGQVLTFDIWVDVNFIESTTKEDEYSDVTPEEERDFLEMAKDPKIHDRILDAIAPAIHGMREVKESAMLMLFGGVDKSFPDGFSTRGQPNVLMVGDPGVAKSQLLRYVQEIAPRGLYTSGKGSSAAGLTAAIIRDPETGEITLEAGAMVLADRGVCLVEGTEILTSTGEIINIEDIVNNNLRIPILSFNPDTFEVETDSIKSTSKRFSDDVFELEFSTGDTISASKEHPLPVWNNELLWKTIEDIKVGDVIIDFRDYNLETPKSCVCTSFEMNEDFAEFLGLIVTDGNLSKEKYRVTFYSKNQELIDHYQELVWSLFEIQPSIYLDPRNDVTRLYFNNKRIHQMIVSMGIPIGNKSNKPIFIKHILHERLNLIHSFLVGVVNGDGSISNRKGGGIIDIVVSNEETAKFYQKLFRKIGIISRKHLIKQEGGGVVPKGDYSNYKVSITGISDIKRFDHPNLVGYKLRNLQKIINRRDNSDRIYKIDGLISSISDKLPHGKKQLLYKNNIRKSTLTRYGITRSTLKIGLNELNKIERVKKTNELSLLNQIIDKDVHFIKVSSKRKLKPQFVYNIQVNRNQTYFANFIPVHNCLIDEFDKMNENDRSAIHEAMEQHTVSVAKAGIVATLNARTGVMAAANPKYGRYEPNRTFNENVNLSPAILSRFDLVFILRDEPEEKKDTVLAGHILNLHRFHGTAQSVKPTMDEEGLKKYIAYAKRNYHPTLSQEATELIETFYVNMRNMYSSSDIENPRDRITITARQLEGIIRLSEARARAGLRSEVTKNDAQRAIDLMKFSLSQVATDPETGVMDIDAFYSGQTGAKRSRLNILRSVIDFVSRQVDGPFEESHLIKEAIDAGLEEKYVKGIIQQMKRDGTLYQPRQGYLDRP